MILGAHTSTTGGIHKAIQIGADLGCECIQIFVKNNLRWFAKPFTPEELAAWSNEMASGKVKSIFGHTSYLLNLAAPEGEKRDNSIKSLICEINLATSLGIPFLVMHPGAHLGSGEDVGLQRIIEGLDVVFEKTLSPVKVALEITAGQGSCLGYKIEHLAHIIEGVKHPERLGVCMDTAHLFAAGYDIRTAEGCQNVINSIEKLIGLQNLLAFHLNDSKPDCSTHIDRHEAIGKGKIGLEAFRYLVNEPRLKNLPGCLETPKSKDLHEDRENLATLRNLIQ